VAEKNTKKLKKVADKIQKKLKSGQKSKKMKFMKHFL
jgi:hypothetical protein